MLTSSEMWLIFRQQTGLTFLFSITKSSRKASNRLFGDTSCQGLMLFHTNNRSWGAPRRRQSTRAGNWVPFGAVRRLRILPPRRRTTSRPGGATPTSTTRQWRNWALSNWEITSRTLMVLPIRRTWFGLPVLGVILSGSWRRNVNFSADWRIKSMSNNFTSKTTLLIGLYGKKLERRSKMKK